MLINCQRRETFIYPASWEGRQHGYRSKTIFRKNISSDISSGFHVLYLNFKYSCVSSCNIIGESLYGQEWASSVSFRLGSLFYVRAPPP